MTNNDKLAHYQGVDDVIYLSSVGYEVWTDAIGYDGYEVSNMGNVRRVKKTGVTMLHPKLHNDYFYVSLCKNGKSERRSVHRLVLLSFLHNPDPENLTQCNHINEIKTDNRLCNLEYCTPKYNVTYSKATPVMCVETSKIYASSIDASEQTGVCHRNIRRCCKGERQTTGSYHWQYVYDNKGEIE